MRPANMVESKKKKKIKKNGQLKNYKKKDRSSVIPSGNRNM